VHPLGPFPLWGKVGMGASPTPDQADAHPAASVFSQARTRQTADVRPPLAPIPAFPQRVKEQNRPVVTRFWSNSPIAQAELAWAAMKSVASCAVCLAAIRAQCVPNASARQGMDNLHGLYQPSAYPSPFNRNASVMQRVRSANSASAWPTSLGGSIGMSLEA
jgi:hypothetical protein